MSAYAAYRQRTVVAYQERDTFRRQSKSPAKRRDGARAPDAPG